MASECQFTIVTKFVIIFLHKGNFMYWNLRQLIECYLHHSLSFLCVCEFFFIVFSDTYPWWEQVWDLMQLFRKAIWWYVSTIYKASTSFSQVFLLVEIYFKRIIKDVHSSSASRNNHGVLFVTLGKNRQEPKSLITRNWFDKCSRWLLNQVNVWTAQHYMKEKVSKI